MIRPSYTEVNRPVLLFSDFFLLSNIKKFLLVTIFVQFIFDDKRKFFVLVIQQKPLNVIFENFNHLVIEIKLIKSKVADKNKIICK